MIEKPTSETVASRETKDITTDQPNHLQPGHSADIIPFPLCRTQSWRFIQQQHAQRRGKAAYAQKVIEGNLARFERLGVAQKHIDAELARLGALFYGNSDADAEKVRA